MRVLTVSETYYPDIGGIPDHIHYLARELRILGHEVDVLAPWVPNSDPASEHVIRVGRGVMIRANKSYARFTVGWRLPAQVRAVVRSGYDIIHIHGSLAPTLPMLALAASRATNVATFHAHHEKSKGYMIGRPVLMPYFRKIDGLIAVSRAAEATMAKYFPGRYRIIPNAVDTREFTPHAPAVPGLPARRPKILFLGRFEPRKGLRYLLQALPIIKEQIPNVLLVVVGSGPFTTYYQELMARAHDIEANVDFVGRIEHAQRASYYAHCDVFCSPSIGNESFGIVLLEAMACGRPVVASDIDGYRAVVHHGREGLLVPPRDPEALAHALVTLLGNRAQAQAMGVAGRARAESFSWPVIARRVSDFYTELTGNGAQR